MATDATGTPTSLGIPKYNTAVDPPSGRGFNAAMDALDLLIGARIPKPVGPAANDALKYDGANWVGAKLSDSSIAAAAGIAVSKLAAGTNGFVLTTVAGVPTWQSPASISSITGDLPATGYFQGASGGGPAEAIRIGNDASLWDVNSADTANLRGLSSATSGWLSFGSGNDTVIGRGGADRVHTPDTLSTAVELYARFSGASQIKLGDHGGNAAVVFGSAADASIRRTAAGELTTDKLLTTPIRATAQRGAAVSLPDATQTVITLDTEVADTDSMFVAGNDRVDITRTGSYRITGLVLFAGDADGVRQVYLQHRNSADIEIIQVKESAASSGTDTHGKAISLEIEATAGDDVRLLAQHTAGNALNVTFARLSVTRIS